MSTGSGTAVGRRVAAIRTLVDLLVCLAVSVSLVRAFVVEDYLITTGSMAPQLVGLHKRIECPECHWSFDRGIGSSDAAEGPRVVTCPHCGQRGIDVRAVPVDEGDQLLVARGPVQSNRPGRWDLCVFRNPNRPTQPYVKRVVGLPGESMQIIAGDIEVNGRTCRKTLSRQQSIRIPVYDDSCRVPGAWQHEPGWTLLTDGFQFSPRAGSASATRRLSYRHLDGDRPDGVRDRYGYNARESRSRTCLVRDLMVSVRATESPGSRWKLELRSGPHRVEWARDRVAGTQWLAIDGVRQASAALATPVSVSGVLIELSTFDRQVLAVVNGQLAFPARPLPGGSRGFQPQVSPVRFVASGSKLGLGEFRLYRDVYYRGDRHRHGVDTPCRLGPDEYFVLGDNSPVSIDSRSWRIPRVPRSLLLGRPVVVHLPSRRVTLSVGNRTVHIRIPDVSRIRYIR